MVSPYTVVIPMSCSSGDFASMTSARISSTSEPISVSKITGRILVLSYPFEGVETVWTGGSRQTVPWEMSLFFEASCGHTLDIESLEREKDQQGDQRGQGRGRKQFVP